MMSAKKSISPSNKSESDTYKHMTLFKNLLKFISVATLFVSANVFSADFLVDTTINDAQGDTIGGSKYEINKMDVKWADNDLITVDIYTNFVDYNNQVYGGRHRNIVLGDLLIGTTGDLNALDYAFVLSNNDRKGDYSNSNHVGNKHWDKNGGLTALDVNNNSTLSSKEYHGRNSNTGSGEVMAGHTTGDTTQGNWSVDNYATWTYDDGNWVQKTDKISFSFNVSGIDAFQNASQLAFSWAMSCANDVVDGVVSVNRPSTNVPEPASLVLMLLALAFMVKIRSQKSDGFSA
jgi:hypothetical protein